MTMGQDELIQRAQALCDGSITLNEFKAWFTYTHQPTEAPQPDAMKGDDLSKALASAPPPPAIDSDPKHHKDKTQEIRVALAFSGFKNIQIERTDYGFAYDIKAEYDGKPVRRTITRPELHLVVDLMRDEAES